MELPLESDIEAQNFFVLSELVEEAVLHGFVGLLRLVLLHEFLDPPSLFDWENWSRQVRLVDVACLAKLSEESIGRVHSLLRGVTLHGFWDLGFYGSLPLIVLQALFLVLFEMQLAQRNYVVVL